ncbi:hypothetical protein [Arthrobacter sp. D3-16]
MSPIREAPSVPSALTRAETVHQPSASVPVFWRRFTVPSEASRWVSCGLSASAAVVVEAGSPVAFHPASPWEKFPLTTAPSALACGLSATAGAIPAGSATAARSVAATIADRRFRFLGWWIFESGFFMSSSLTV